MFKGQNCALEDDIIFHLDLENFIDLNFTYLEIVVSSLLVQGFEIKEIAELQHVSRSYITRVVRSLRSKLRNFIYSFSKY